MATVRTAISIDRVLFNKMERPVFQRRASRSRLYAAAVEEFLQRRHAGRLVEQINRTHADAGGADTPRLQRATNESLRCLLQSR